MGAERPRQEESDPKDGQGWREEEMKQLAFSLRGGGRRGVETRSAVLGMDEMQEHERVEFFTGKDFIRTLRKHYRGALSSLVPKPERVSPLPEKGSFSSKADARKALVQREKEDVDSRAKTLGNTMLDHGYFYRVERRYNKQPPSGNKKRVKFPKYLEPCAEQSFDPHGFFAWRYERPASAWSYVYSGLLVLVVLACCLLQVAPSRIKVVVFYSTLSLFALLVATLVLRVLVYASTWTATGWHFWLLPNLLSDDAPTVFKPVYKLEKPSKANKMPLWKRFSFVGAGLAAIVASYFVSPSGTSAKVGDATRYATDQMLDILNMRQELSSINGSAQRDAYTPSAPDGTPPSPSADPKSNEASADPESKQANSNENNQEL